MQMTKIKIFEKEKLDEFKMAKKKGDEARAKKVLCELLWSQDKNKELTRVIVGKIQRAKILKPKSVERLLSSI
jgi:ribosomal protein S28E/S33